VLFSRPALVYSQSALLKSKAVLVWSAKASPGSIGFDACIGLGITCGSRAAELLRFWSAATSGIQFLLAGGILDSSAWSWQWQRAEVRARAAYVTLVSRARTSHYVAAWHRMQHIESNMSKYSISSHKILGYILSKYMLLCFHIIDHFASHYTNLFYNIGILFYQTMLCHLILQCITSHEFVLSGDISYDIVSNYIVE